MTPAFGWGSLSAAINVKERRFSAALRVVLKVGFSPGRAGWR
jgi:hypothetical protein